MWKCMKYMHHHMFSIGLLHVYYVVIIFLGSLYIYYLFIICSLSVHYMLMICWLMINYVLIVYLLYVHYMFVEKVVMCFFIWYWCELKPYLYVICLRLLRTNSPETSSTHLLGLVKVRVQACPAASRAHDKFRATACPVASGARDKVRAQACPARDRVGAEACPAAFGACDMAWAHSAHSHNNLGKEYCRWRGEREEGRRRIRWRRWGVAPCQKLESLTWQVRN